MRTHISIRTGIATLVGLASLVALPEGRAEAFSTGNHFTITARALSREQFSGSAIAAVQTANYNVDHYSDLKDQIMSAGSTWQRAKNVGNFFHYDELFTWQEIERELAWHEAGMATVLASAKARRDVTTIIQVLGIESHAVQDFYSHANFADMDWTAWKGTPVVVMSDLPRDIRENPRLSTFWMQPSDVHGLLSGKPGASPYGTPPLPSFPRHTVDGDSSTRTCTDFDSAFVCGVHHDNARRRENLLAVLMATEAMIELTEHAKALINDPQLWSQVQNFDGGIGASLGRSRAQDFSLAADQWGANGAGQSDIQIGITFFTYYQVPVQLLMQRWEDNWLDTLFALWSAAPAAHATGGGADAFPSNATPLFQLPTAPPVPNAMGYAGSYIIHWGAQAGTMVLSQQNGHLVGSIGVPGKAFQITKLESRNGGFDVRVHDGSADGRLAGQLFPVGPAASHGLSGYLRSDVTGAADGLTAAFVKLATPPGGLPAQMR